PLRGADGRFAGLRRRFDARLVQRSTVGTWWNECVVGLLEPVEFRLEEKPSGVLAARALVWEMEGYSGRWNHPAAGVLEVQVRSDLRRQGLAKFLITQIMKTLQDQYFGIAEVQTSERNPSALALFRALGFEQVDVGRVYVKGAGRE